MQFMYAGAALSVVNLVIGLADTSQFKSAIRSAYPHYTQAQVNNAANAAIAAVVVVGLIGVGLWLWMAWANGRGRRWARNVSSALFSLNTLDLLLNLSQHAPLLSMLLGVVEWGVGLGAIINLWNRQSSEYFGSSR
jgi:hypothetical protein